MEAAVPILLYHSVSEGWAHGFREWSVHPTTFESHMTHLRDHGYTPVTISQLVAMTDSPARLPERPVAITFDNGLADFYATAWPVLQRFGFAVTMYVPTGFVGGTSRWLTPEGEGDRPLMQWPQLANLAQGWG